MPNVRSAVDLFSTSSITGRPISSPACLWPAVPAAKTANGSHVKLRRRELPNPAVPSAPTPHAAPPAEAKGSVVVTQAAMSVSPNCRRFFQLDLITYAHARPASTSRIRTIAGCRGCSGARRSASTASRAAGSPFSRPANHGDHCKAAPAAIGQFAYGCRPPDRASVGGEPLTRPTCFFPSGRCAPVLLDQWFAVNENPGCGLPPSPGDAPTCR